MENPLISIGKAADILGVCQDSLRRWERKGEFTAIYTIGGHRRYRRSDISAFYENKRKTMRKQKIMRVSADLLKDCLQRWLPAESTIESVGWDSVTGMVELVVSSPVYATVAEGAALPEVEA